MTRTTSHSETGRTDDDRDVLTDGGRVDESLHPAKALLEDATGL